MAEMPAPYLPEFWERWCRDMERSPMSKNPLSFGTATPANVRTVDVAAIAKLAATAPHTLSIGPKVQGPAAVLSVRVLIPTPNPSNASGWTWQKRMTLAKKTRKAVALVLFGDDCPPPPWAVTMTRVSAGTLADDGLRSALKWVRDSIAVYLLGGKPGEMDDSPSISWRYAQARGKRGQPCVDIEIRTRQE